MAPLQAISVLVLAIPSAARLLGTGFQSNDNGASYKSIPQGLVNSVHSLAHQVALFQERVFQHSRKTNDVPSGNGFVTDLIRQALVPPNTPTEEPITNNAPEALGNVLNYKIAQPTPPPVVMGGVYCRGGACQFRVTPPTTIAPLTTTLPYIGSNLKEFCRGLACKVGDGLPTAPSSLDFNTKCMHLLVDVGGGIKGKPGQRSIRDVYDAWIAACKKRVGPLEVASCPTYADVFVAALAPAGDAPDIGDAEAACSAVYIYISMIKTAEVDLKLLEAALPKSGSLLSLSLNRLGTGGVGPQSPRGLRFKAWAKEHIFSDAIVQSSQDEHQGVVETSYVQRADGSRGTPCQGGFAPSLLQEEPATTPPPHGPHQQYIHNSACADGPKLVPQSQTKYQIAPGSPDGAVPPAEITGNLFNYCGAQMSEVMLGFSQTAASTVTMTRNWCRWQSSITTWVGQKEEYGRPDWNRHTCDSMAQLVAFSFRDDLESPAGYTPPQVCRKLFLTIGAVHRVAALVDDAWSISMRGAAAGNAAPPSAGDAEMKKLLQAAASYSDEVFGKLRAQQQAFNDLNTAKMDVSSFDENNIKVGTPADTEPPPLPDSSSFDPMQTSLVSVGTSHLRRWGTSDKN